MQTYTFTTKQSKACTRFGVLERPAAQQTTVLFYVFKLTIANSHQVLPDKHHYIIPIS